MNEKHYMKQRINSLLSELKDGVFEKDTELSLSLLAALAGQSILLLGPPGVAKSMVARRLKYAFADAKSFEYLMSRFSTPDEIFGPVSISKLKESDRYERATEGYLPSADVVFLDEIWKAGPAIQNTLLTVINEKTYLNGATQMKLPLKLLIAASNELPTEGEGLEAIFDRFIVRVLSKPIESEDMFYEMVSASSGSAPRQENLFDGNNAFTSEEYAQLQREIDAIVVPQNVLQAITRIRKSLKDVKIPNQDVHREIYVSDRRWKNIVRLLKTSALLHDRKEVVLADLQIAVHCLWSEPDEIAPMGEIVAKVIFSDYLDRLDKLQNAVNYGMNVRRVRESLDRAHERGDHRDDDLIIFDHFYYGVDEKSSPNTYIYVTDFRSMPTHTSNEPAVRGVMYQDPKCPKRKVIRAYSNPDNIGEYDVELTRVNLYRDSSALYINGVRCPMRRGLRGSVLEQSSGLEPVKGDKSKVNESFEQYESEVDNLFQEATISSNSFKSHLFISPIVTKIIAGQMDSFKRQIALLRADVRKLVYDE